MIMYQYALQLLKSSFRGKTLPTLSAIWYVYRNLNIDHNWHWDIITENEIYLICVTEQGKSNRLYSISNV